MASLTPLSGTLGKQKAAHLLRRASFVYTKSDIDTIANKTAETAVNDLFNFVTPTVPEPLDYQTGDHWINMGVPPVSASFHLNRFVKGWWVDEAMQSLSIEYKLIFFLHTTFTTSVFDHASEDFWDHLELLRFYAKGSFREFALKVTMSNLMAEFLDNQFNFGFNPNENYAREFFELFTIGKGPQVSEDDYTTFTELDVQQATKVMSGWRKGDRSNPAHVDPDTGLNACYAVYVFHENSDKTFSHRFQNTVITGAVDEDDMYRELSDLIDLVFAQSATAFNLARKIYRYYVRPTISAEIETDIITPLANDLINNDYDLELVVKKLLKSEHFYDEDDSTSGDEIIGAMIKPPLDLITQTVTYFDIERPDPYTETFWHYLQFYHRAVLNDIFEGAAFNLFSPEIVSGYPAYAQAPTYDENWFHSSSIIPRYLTGKMMLTGKRIYVNELIGSQLDIVVFVDTSGNFTDASDSDLLVTELLEQLFPFTVDTARHNYFLNTIFLANISSADWTTEWQNYQSSGDDSIVKPPLEDLIEAVLYAPEYHVF